MPVSLTVRVYFEAAHRLHNPERDEAWNRETYGKCANPYGHGHNYTLEVTVEGPVDPETGYVVDMKRLKAILAATVVSEVDHRHLNHEVPWLSGINPTAENLAVAFARRIAPALPDGVRLTAVSVHETERNRATWRPD
jgi:6-pyruvoyltetrahydropterin/6-carboxytetrahydropterin synthase